MLRENCFLGNLELNWLLCIAHGKRTSALKNEDVVNHLLSSSTHGAGPVLGRVILLNNKQHLRLQHHSPKGVCLVDLQKHFSATVEWYLGGAVEYQKPFGALGLQSYSTGKTANTGSLEGRIENRLANRVRKV